MTDSFADYVAARGQALTRTAYLLTGDHGLAEDLAQSALGLAYAKWFRVSTTDSPGAYVRRAMVNQRLQGRTSADESAPYKIDEVSRTPGRPGDSVEPRAGDRSSTGKRPV